MDGVAVGGVTMPGVRVGRGVRSGTDRFTTGFGLGVGAGVGFGVGLGVGFGVAFGVGLGVAWGVGFGVGVGGTVTTTEPAASAASNLSLLRDRKTTSCVPAASLPDQLNVTPFFQSGALVRLRSYTLPPTLAFTTSAGEAF
jgi:hypothetical protein